MVSELLEHGRKKLSQASFSPPRREANLLLGHVLGLSEAQILARSTEEVSESASQRFIELLGRRVEGEPVAYLLGHREFYGRNFRVDSRVLIPRPETEHLVETVLALPLPRYPKILDLGTGSGCLAATFAAELGDASIVAVDRSPGALELAAVNLRALGQSARVRLLASDLAQSLALESFDIVVSNPPYIGHEERAGLSPEVRDFEPHQALFPPGAADSMIARLITESSSLRSGAFLVFEISHRQSDRVRNLLERSAFELERLVEDYQGIPRIVVARRR